MAYKGGVMTDASVVMPSRRVEMWYAGTAAQNRWTVGFRVILAIPQFIVLDILFIAFFFVLVIGWFAALFTGRLPEWAHTFLGGVIRWYARVAAYIFLLTDRYPPFSLDDVEYPVRPILPGRGPLNRVSVFFRIILAVPAAVFYEIVLYGLTVPLLFFMWIVVLFRGSMPPALYDAYAALLRYQVRFHSWFSMLTSEYAWGMLGDFVPPPAAATQPLPAASPTPTFPTPPPTAPTAPASPAQPFAYPTTPGEQVAAPTPEPEDAPAPPVWPPPQPAPTTAPFGAMPPPSPWERTSTGSEVDPSPPWAILVLQGAARAWMIFAIVWGSILFIGQNAFRSVGNGNGNGNGQTMVVELGTLDVDTVHVDTVHLDTSGFRAVLPELS
jgi:hypothetical protein